MSKAGQHIFKLSDVNYALFRPIESAPKPFSTVGPYLAIYLCVTPLFSGNFSLQKRVYGFKTGKFRFLSNREINLTINCTASRYFRKKGNLSCRLKYVIFALNFLPADLLDFFKNINSRLNFKIFNLYTQITSKLEFGCKIEIIQDK